MRDDSDSTPLERLAERLMGSRLVLGVTLVLAAIPMTVYVVADLTPRAHLALSFLIVAAGVLLARKTPRLRLAIVLLSLAASFRYILWRATHTMDIQGVGDLIVGWALFGAEMYAFITLLMGYFQTAIYRRRRPFPLPADTRQLPTVDIFIPSYNEGPDVVGPTIMGALAIEYPKKRVFLLDDGRRDEIKDLCERLGCEYIIRPDNKGAKAGNINHALEYTDGELITIFDADHVPVRGFLRATVGFFLNDDRCALVQTPHHFYNPDPFERNLYLEGRVPSEQHLFYHGIQLGNDFWNSAFFCGSCAVLRRDALLEVGGIAQETVTEDAHTALKMHARGWNSVFYDVPLAAGLATETFAFHVGQRIRWARGMAQILRQDNPLFKKGLKLPQRLNYFNAAWHFFFGLPRLIFMVAPAAYLLLDFHPLSADVREVLIYAIPHLILAGVGAATMHRNVRHSFWPEVYEVSIAPYTAMVTTVAMFFPKLGSFNVTDKGATSETHAFDWSNAFPLVILVAISVLSILAVPFKLHAQPLDQDTIFVAGLWAVYNLLVLGAACAAAFERPQRRRYHRVDKRKPALVTPVHDAEAWMRRFDPIEGVTTNLSLGGIALRLPGSRRLPKRVNITLRGPYGTTSTFGMQVIAHHLVGDATLVRGRFTELDHEQEKAIAGHIFGETDSWVKDRFTHDSPIRSGMNVVMAPVVAAFKGPRWLSQMSRTGGAADPLVPDAAEQLEATEELYLPPPNPGPEDERHEPSTAESSFFGDETTELVEEGPRLPFSAEASALVRAPPKTGLLPLVFPAILLMLGFGLTVGWSPVVRGFSLYMPMERYESVTLHTRLAELNQAHKELDLLNRQLRTAKQLAINLPPSWSATLWTVRRDYKLYGDPGHRPECADIEIALYSAMLSMASADKELRETSDTSTVEPRLDSIQENLNSAARRLKSQI